MKIAIVTGASSGMGREFVRQLSQREHPDEIWAIARREERLKELGYIVPTKIKAIPLDLTKPGSIDKLQELLDTEKPEVSLLVNNAGVGKMGDYSQISRQDVENMINLNCIAAVNVTLAVLPYMKENGRIIEMCSSSGFQPLPGLNVYAASKAFLLHFSRALRWELFDRGIDVMAVCPYWVKDTEFIPISRQTKNRYAITNFAFSMKARDVVSQVLRDSKHGKAVSVPGGMGKVQRAAAKLMPTGASIAVWEFFRRI